MTSLRSGCSPHPGRDYIEQKDGIHTYPQVITPPESQWALRCRARWIGELLANPAEAPTAHW